MPRSSPTSIATVSAAFVEDWLTALRGYCPKDQMASFMHRSGLNETPDHPAQRVNLDQIVRLYQIAAVETEDEMMGLWNRPVRARALQHLLTTVREAATLPSALFRFTTFWNLLLDEYQLGLQDQEDRIVLELVPKGAAPVQRFGHMLILKLAHGLLSWLAGYEVPVRAVQFAFERPDFAEDYAVVFPARPEFDTPVSAISFDITKLALPEKRSNADLEAFLKGAPRDWIFTGFHQHSRPLQIREFLFRSNWEKCELSDAARALRMTPRTLMRRLDVDGTSFQEIKDGLRRDIAIRDLRDGRKSIEEIAQDVGFSSAANFHRAFRKWTGATPGSFR